MDSQEKFAVVVPFYNEEEICKEFSIHLKKFLKQNQQLTFVLVCDHCTDRTFQFLQANFQTDDRVIVAESVNAPGYGAAIRYGFNFLLKHNLNWAITIDSDLSNTFEEVEKLCKFITHTPLSLLDECAIIKGNRFGSFRQGLKSAPLKRKVLTISANIVSRILVPKVCSDPTNGFRAVNLRWFESQIFIENQFPSIIEELYLAVISQKRILDFPTSLNYKFALRNSSSFVFNYQTNKGYLKYLIKICLYRLNYYHQK